MELTPKVELLIDNLRKTGYDVWIVPDISSDAACMTNTSKIFVYKNGTMLEGSICSSCKRLSHDESSILSCIINLANKIKDAEKKKGEKIYVRRLQYHEQ